MATRFELFLVGVDEEHLRAVGEAALDEIARVERLLSRHDPASAVARVNREAAGRPVRVDRELFAILEDCRSWSDRTVGYFDPCATGEANSPRFDRAVSLDPDHRTIRFLEPTTRLDFGGYGKGYALDSAALVLDEFGVESAFCHGGTSSILARGWQADGSAWRVGLRDPFDGSERVQLELGGCGLASSSAFGPGSARSDLVDPIQSRPLDRQSACSVIAPTALEAEVLSTAFLAMGKERASSLLGSLPGVRVAWSVGVEFEWLGSGAVP